MDRGQPFDCLCSIRRPPSEHAGHGEMYVHLLKYNFKILVLNLGISIRYV